jgi:hypothetical protein
MHLGKKLHITKHWNCMYIDLKTLEETENKGTLGFGHFEKSKSMQVLDHRWKV